MDRWIDRWMDEWMDGWMDGWMNGWMDGWMDGWLMNGWMNEWIYEYIYIYIYIYITTAETTEHPVQLTKPLRKSGGQRFQIIQYISTRTPPYRSFSIIYNPDPTLTMGTPHMAWAYSIRDRNGEIVLSSRDEAKRSRLDSSKNVTDRQTDRQTRSLAAKTHIFQQM